MAKLADHEIIPAVLAKIEAMAAKLKWRSDQLSPCDTGECSSCNRLRASKERLEDFATVELLCEGLGITRKEIE